ncbi:replication factor C subunit 1 [Diutina catenulata]
MVSIDDFFGKKAPPKKAGAKPAQPAKPIVVDSDSDVEETAKAPPKKATKPTPSPRKPAPKRKAAVIESDDDEPAPKPAPKPKASPKKPAAKASPKKRAPAKAKAAKPAQESAGGLHARDIIDTIPDAELPDVDPSKKVNFFAKKAESGSTEPPEISEAAPNCLLGLTIVFTGQLPTMGRDASKELAEKYGARVTGSISGKTDIVVIGDEAGPSKVEKIKKLKIKAIDEDGFVELLRRMPADGGDGEAAQKAKQKREDEAEAVLAAAEADAAAEAAAEEAAQENRAKRIKLESPKKPVKGEVQDQWHSQPKEAVPASEQLWTTKYAPRDTKSLCGNKGQIEKLRHWLQNWFQYKHEGFGSSHGAGGNFRAAMISGPPGIGKTSAAHIIARELGYDVVEKNASDVRSKSLLNQELKSVLDNSSVVGFFHQRAVDAGEHQTSENTANRRKFVLIMDEVDGMSSGDHGGAGALANFCKITQMPLVLICNERNLPKMRVFDQKVMELPFRRPKETEVRSRLMMIAHREKIKLEPSVINQLLQATGSDMRQMINLMSHVSKTTKTIGQDGGAALSKAWKKQTQLKPFDIAGKLLSAQTYLENSGVSTNDKIDLFFNDIDFTPLMIQENYIGNTISAARGNPQRSLELVAEAADYISESDRVNNLIRSAEQQWSLLPFMGVLSSVLPASKVAGNTGRTQFSMWLGQNSKQNKFQRMLQELYYHTRLTTSTDKTALRLDYMGDLSQRLTRPLIKEGDDGIDAVIEFMDTYYMTRDDFDNVVDFGVGPMRGEPILKQVPTKTKSAFTRKYNGATHPTAIYKTGNSTLGTAKKQSVDYDGVVEDDTAKDDDKDDEKEDDGIDAKKDKLIKEVKRPKKRAAAGGAKKPAAKRAKKN